MAVPAYVDLIGTPFAYGGRGATLDCYGLVKELFRRDGIEIPEQAAPDNLLVQEQDIAAVLNQWRQVEPGPGTVVLFRVPFRETRREHVCHMGYQINKNEFIHTWRATGGVTIERLADWSHRIAGHYRYEP